MGCFIVHLILDLNSSLFVSLNAQDTSTVCLPRKCSKIYYFSFSLSIISHSGAECIISCCHQFDFEVALDLKYGEQ